MPVPPDTAAAAAPWSVPPPPPPPPLYKGFHCKFVSPLTHCCLPYFRTQSTGLIEDTFFSFVRRVPAQPTPLRHMSMAAAAPGDGETSQMSHRRSSQGPENDRTTDLFFSRGCGGVLFPSSSARSRHLDVCVREMSLSLLLRSTAHSEDGRTDSFRGDAGGSSPREISKESSFNPPPPPPQHGVGGAQKNTGRVREKENGFVFIF